MMGVPDVPLRIITHKKKVCNLYKRALRALQSMYSVKGRAEIRYQCVVLRDQFEKNRDVCKDVAKTLLIDGERELFNRKPLQVIEFAGTYGGLLFNRVITPSDAVLDSWHPLEKARYPKYFARREERKKEFIEWWNETYSKKETCNRIEGNNN